MLVTHIQINNIKMPTSCISFSFFAFFVKKLLSEYWKWTKKKCPKSIFEKNFCVKKCNRKCAKHNFSIFS